MGIIEDKYKDDTIIALGVLSIAFFCLFVWQFSKQSHSDRSIHREQIHDTINTIKIDLDTIFINRWKNRTIYETKIERVYMLDSAGVSDEYQRVIAGLDSLEKTGFFERE